MYIFKKKKTKVFMGFSLLKFSKIKFLLIHIDFMN